MMDGHASDPLGPVILGLGFIVVFPALIGLTTPLWQGVSAIILLGLGSLLALWIVSRVSVRAPAVIEGGED
jgi:uncharacterized membrane protein (DUF485 family)